ncbi:hypothetical protein OG552_30810 [Streptomyces sp. NBC_01476]|uniref:hypothetical protein n=1 Tax=Streptomyces sp. NBC_01476 TaxID=2903881 RepID=UPI002E352BF3|nr:hypothetical protein [Streptomyces sp. NBC_01476]
MHQRRPVQDPPLPADGPGLPAGPAPAQTYTRRTCEADVEAIGQARAVKYLSDHLESPSQRLISPDVQWEMSLPGGERPDIVTYDRTDAAAGVEVIEAKIKGENADYPQWGTHSAPVRPGAVSQ